MRCGEGQGVMSPRGSQVRRANLCDIWAKNKRWMDRECGELIKENAISFTRHHYSFPETVS